MIDKQITNENVSFVRIQKGGNTFKACMQQNNGTYSDVVFYCDVNEMITELSENLQKNEISKIAIITKGCSGAEHHNIIQTFQSNDIEISMIKDVTPIPHNGCWPFGCY